MTESQTPIPRPRKSLDLRDISFFKNTIGKHHNTIEILDINLDKRRGTLTKRDARVGRRRSTLTKPMSLQNDDPIFETMNLRTKLGVLSGKLSE